MLGWTFDVSRPRQETAGDDSNRTFAGMGSVRLRRAVSCLVPCVRLFL